MAFESLTRYIARFEEEGYGEWANGWFLHGKATRDFLHDLYSFADANTHYDMYNYRAILKEAGILGGCGLTRLDVNALDAKTTLAIITFVVRGDRFCEGMLASYLEGGDILRWLKHLQNIDSELP